MEAPTNSDGAPQNVLRTRGEAHDAHRRGAGALGSGFQERRELRGGEVRRGHTPGGQRRAGARVCPEGCLQGVGKPLGGGRVGRIS